MRGLVVILLGLAVALFLHHRWEPPALLVDASEPLPAVRLYTICPVVRRNFPIINEVDNA